MTPADRAQLIAELKDALALHPSQLTEEEQAWVRLAIQKEAQSIAFRKAIIEKTITGLVWSAVVGCGYVFLDFLRNHGLRL
jgi:hypothetical protein